MTGHYECTLHKIMQQGVATHHISLDEITSEERSEKKFLGTAAGRDIWHCLHLGARHCEKEFLKQVKWYYLSPEENECVQEMREREPETIVVDFYGAKTV